MKFGGVDVKFADITRVANMKNARHFANHVVPHVVRPAQVIWNQAIGALFFILAIPALFKALQMYRDLKTDPKGEFGIFLSLVFASVMLFFGIGSLLKARRIARR
jgi:hypothetical protein